MPSRNGQTVQVITRARLRSVQRHRVAQRNHPLPAMAMQVMRAALKFPIMPTALKLQHQPLLMKHIALLRTRGRVALHPQTTTTTIAKALTDLIQITGAVMGHRVAPRRQPSSTIATLEAVFPIHRSSRAARRNVKGQKCQGHALVEQATTLQAN